MHFKTGYYWSSGGSPYGNQDSLTLQHVAYEGGEALLAAVCDGIGSLEGSQDASARVVYHLTKWFYNEGKELIRGKPTPPVMLMALQGCIDKIKGFLQDVSISTGVTTGTTCSALLMLDGFYYLIHIGDCRIYQISKNNPFYRLLKKDNYTLKLLSRDDVDHKGRLIRALGTDPTDKASFAMGRLKRDSVFLICSDGFYYGNEDRIARMLSKGEDLDRRLELLAQNAFNSGNRDNKSAVVIKAV